MTDGAPGPSPARRTSFREAPPTTLDEALARLAEAEATLRAIGAGEVDAFVVAVEERDHHVFSLSTADRPYRMFVENMREGAATVSASGTVLFANDRLAELLSLPKESVIGTSIARLVDGPVPLWSDERDPVDGHRRSTTMQLELIASGGGRVPVLIGASALVVGGELLTCLTFTDLSEQRAHEQEIERLNKEQIATGMRFAAVVEALQEGVLVQDAQGCVLEANHMASEIMRIPLDKLLTEPPTPLRWNAAPSGPRATTGTPTPGRQALIEGTPLLGVVLAVDRGDERTWLEINSVPLQLPEEGEDPVVISSFRDVTARVVSDEAIRFQALLLDTAGQAIIAVDADSVVLYWNRYAEHMYGWTAQEATGRPIADLILNGETIEQSRDFIASLKGGETQGSDHWVRRRDGTRFPVFSTITGVVDDHESTVALITVATDITERKRAEDQARQLTAIIESSSDAVVSLDLDHVITTWNPGATSLFGYEAYEVIGQNLSVLVSSVERYRDLTLQTIEQGMSLRNVETQGITKTGQLVHVSLSISPMLDEHGDIVGLSVIGRDVTSRVELEAIAAQQREDLDVARHAAELEAIERDEANRANRAKSEFLSRMSHELRTPLNAVLGFAQILLLDDLTADQRENVAFIRSAGEHLLDLINDVLDISRIEAGALKLSLEPVHLNEVVAQALSMIRLQAERAGITMHNDIGAHPEVYVLSDRQRLLQVVLNLLSNAVKYNRPSGRVDLYCESSGGTISLAVADSGVGICEADLGKLFTPFERLGAEGGDIEGTGVGLALSRALSQQMGGSLNVFSEAGHGSTFTLEMPDGGPSALETTAIDAAPAMNRATATDPDLAPMTVLVIEDNVANVRLMERALQRCDGVVLLSAIQGRLGIDLAIVHRPDLILLDLHLPDVPGETVLQHLGADPTTASIPVVICSADASPTQAAHMIEQGAAGYLTKPFDLSGLYELIERVRAGKAGVGTTPQKEPIP